MNELTPRRVESPAPLFIKSVGRVEHEPPFEKGGMTPVCEQTGERVEYEPSLKKRGDNFLPKNYLKG